MTDAQIEAVARLYCRKLGLDPDEVQMSYFVDDVRNYFAMTEAIAEVRATVTEG